MKKLIKKLKNNNGFTLVELMISVAIFALIASPLIHSYLTAQATSRRSHYLGDATLAASNIIETIKAAGAEAVLFNTAVLGTAEDCGCPDEPHSFHLMNYSAGMSAFDIAVTLNAEPFDDINSRRITEYSPMDAVFAQPECRCEPEPDEDGNYITLHTCLNPDIMADFYLETRANISGAVFEPDDIRRVITVTITDDSNQAQMHALYTYTLITPADTFTFTQEYEFFRERLCADDCEVTDTTCARCVNKAVYFCYQPFYRGIDIIEIRNTPRFDLSFFVVKQFPDLSLEAGYNAVIKQYEQDGTPSGEHKMRVFSNFNINPNNGGEIDTCRLWIHEFGMVYDITTTSGELVSHTQRDRMYSVTVEVFSRGELEAGGRAMLRIGAAQLD
jgi:prepilin-type N-terminal cleavage/methylation domain-containing protein